MFGSVDSSSTITATGTGYLEVINSNAGAGNSTLNGNVSSPGGLYFYTANTTFNANTYGGSFLRAQGGNINYASNNLTFATANITLGSITGTGKLTLTGISTWTSGGTMAGTGTTLIPLGATLNVSHNAGYPVLSRILENAGTINWSGSPYAWQFNGGTLNNDPSGVINDSAGNPLTNTGGTNAFNNAGTFNKLTAADMAINIPFSNTGTVNVQGGVLELTAGVPQISGTTLTAGTWIISNSILRIPANISTNNANLTLDGASAAFYNALTGTTSAIANLSTNAGTLVFTNGQSFTSPTATFTTTGALVIGPNSTFTATTLALNGGLLAGAGTIHHTVLPGAAPQTIHPGIPGSTAPATLTIETLSTNANTTLAFDLTTPSRSPATPSTNDQIAITSSLSLNGGRIEITSAPSGPASPGYYTLIQSTAPITNTASLTIPANTTRIHYALDTTRNPNALDLHIGFVGDANDDGRIDLTDLAAVLNNFNVTTSSWAKGNFEGAATINVTDLQDVLNNFGTTAPTLTLPALQITPTPEPATIAPLLLATLLLKRRRPHRSH